MTNDRWLPVKHELPDGMRLGKFLHSGQDWQIYRLGRDESVLIARISLVNKWVKSSFLPSTVFSQLSFCSQDYKYLLSGTVQKLEPITSSKSPETKLDGLSFAISLYETRKIDTQVPLQDSIYVERYSRLLPTWTVSEAISDEEILGKWLTGGVKISATSFRRLSSLLGWLGQNDIVDLVEAAGFNATNPPNLELQVRNTKDLKEGLKESKAILPSDADDTPIVPSRMREFCLPGRPQLEAFFIEHVIDIVENPQLYKHLGIEFPTAVVLHGPPGCGKTFSVERLGEYLDWPIFYVDSNSIGSPYIHETSKKIGEIFDKAIDVAPSMIVIDEMESCLSDRQLNNSTGLHHVEEMAEFLRRIPEANKHNVLVIGMTNRLEMIDSAIIRRGRFDHVVEVGMPSATEVSSLIDSLLNRVSVENNIDTSNVVESLTGRAISDAVFVIREAARLAARARQNSIKTENVLEALASLPPVRTNDQSIGFVRD